MVFSKSESEVFFRRLNKKIFLFTIMVAVGFTVLTMRLWHLQIMQHAAFSSRAESNRIRELTLDGLRGKIFDRNGLMLVDNRPSFQLSMIPEDVSNPEKILGILSQAVSLDVNRLLKELKTANRVQPFTLKRDISRKEVAFVEERRIDLPGIYLRIKPIRRYIHGELGSHILGYLGAITSRQLAKTPPLLYSRDDFIGQSGVEKVNEEKLRGSKGIKLMEVDAFGRELRRVGLKLPTSGSDLHLTLDYYAQKAAEKAFEGKIGALVAIDPENGDILAFLSKPSFDPNILSFGIKPAEWQKLIKNEFHPLQNRVTQGQYPPGSTFKVAMAAAALTEGVITPETTMFCPGHFTLGRRTYRCWKKGGHGAMNLHQALVQSCDVFFYKVGLNLGINNIAKYTRMLGLGKRTGIDLEGEKAGLIPTTEWKERTQKQPWIIGETVSCSIGQGFVLSTPIQLARMIAAIANGGKLVTPRITKTDDAEPVTEGVGSISSQTISLIKKALHGAVHEPHGTGWRLKNGPFDYSGKTGTAQVIRMKQNEEWDNEKVKFIHRDHALFVAFAPYDKPKIAIAVIAEHSGHGGAVAAPIAKKVMDAYLENMGGADEKKKTAGREYKINEG